MKSCENGYIESQNYTRLFIEFQYKVTINKGLSLDEGIKVYSPQLNDNEIVLEIRLNN